ncbi:MAG: DUF6468 domain-containing protein [Kiloniellaceae bacterium]
MSWLQDYGLVFDVVICLLLVTTIGFAIALNRKLSVLHSARGELEKLFADFASATGQAEGGLQALKQGSGEASQALAKNVADACRLAEEMTFLVKKGDEIADRLEVSISASRKASQVQAPVHAAAPLRAATPQAAATASGPPPPAAASRHGIDTGAPQGAPEKAAPRGIGKIVKRKLSGADSELMRALQVIR